MKELFLSAGGFAVGTAATIALGLLMQDRIEWMIARAFGRMTPKGPRNVVGIWRANYNYQSKGVDLTERQLIELRQIGRHVWGRNLTADHHWYRMSGKLTMETYLTGVWENIDECDIYHGAFQFVVKPDGKEMRGRWIGFNQKQDIKDGPWEWFLITRDVDDESKLEAIKHYGGDPGSNPC